MNLIGGVGFAGAILYFGYKLDITKLSDVLNACASGKNLVIPATLLAIAGLSKAAQLPFSKRHLALWLHQHRYLHYCIHQQWLKQVYIY